MNKTLYSKPTTAESMPAGRRGDKAMKTMSISNGSAEKRYRMMSGRSGATVRGTYKGVKRAPKQLAIDQQNKLPFHSSSQPTTAMSVKNKSEMHTRALGAGSANVTITQP